MFRIDIIFRGRVQCVGFRAFVKEVADDMSICGRVWNNYDGSLQLVAYIDTKADIDLFVDRVKSGPEMATVKEYSISITPSDPYIENFFEVVD